MNYWRERANVKGHAGKCNIVISSQDGRVQRERARQGQWDRLAGNLNCRGSCGGIHFDLPALLDWPLSVWRLDELMTCRFAGCQYGANFRFDSVYFVTLPNLKFVAASAAGQDGQSTQQRETRTHAHTHTRVRSSTHTTYYWTDELRECARARLLQGTRPDVSTLKAELNSSSRCCRP